MDWLLVEIPFIDVPVLLVLGLIGFWFLVRNRQTPLEPGRGLQGVVGRGEPLVLEFFGKL